MKRRRFLKLAGAGTAALAATVGGGAIWLSSAPAPVAGFASFAEARTWLAQLSANPAAYSLTDWSLAQVLEHCAQSVEFSLTGFPQPKPPLFQDTVGHFAFASFNRAGAMHHSVIEPIPGAPALVATDLGVATQRLLAAFAAFEAHDAPLSPHFAYGALDKPAYERAHLMHLANHARHIALA